MPQLETKALQLEAQCNAMNLEEEDKVRTLQRCFPMKSSPDPSTLERIYAMIAQVEEYMLLLERLAQLQAEMRELLMSPRHSLPFLQPGRLVRVLPELRPAGKELPAFADLTDEEVAAASAAFGDRTAG